MSVGWTTLQQSAWVYPVLEIVHLLGVALLLGNLVLFELRLLGLGRNVQLEPLAWLALPLVLTGFGLAAVSGMTMFASRPLDLLPNSAFRLKMFLLLVGGANAAWFHARGALRRRDRLADAQALASLLIWVAVLACGRLIAYV